MHNFLKCQVCKCLLISAKSFTKLRHKTASHTHTEFKSTSLLTFNARTLDRANVLDSSICFCFCIIARRSGNDCGCLLACKTLDFASGRDDDTVFCASSACFTRPTTFDEAADGFSSPRVACSKSRSSNSNCDAAAAHCVSSNGRDCCVLALSR